MKLTQFFLLPALLLLLISCNEDDGLCPEDMRLEPDMLSNEALAYNPFSEDDLVAVFTDSVGAEYNFSIERNEIQESYNFVEDFCYDSEFIRLYLRGIDLPVYFHIWINDVQKPNDDNASGEGLIVFYSKREDNATSITVDGVCLEHSINLEDESGNPLYTDRTLVLDTLTLNGKAYPGVIVNNFPEFDPEYDAFYNTTMGLVGFTNTTTGATYNLVRIE